MLNTNSGMITRKRKRINDNDNLNNENKKKKFNINWDEMISASRVRNFLLNDPLLDWLQEYNIKDLTSKPEKKKRSGEINMYPNVNAETNFTNFIMNQGLMFESKVYEFLKNKFQTVQIAESYQAKCRDKFEETIRCMKNGIEIIYQGVLHDYKNKIFGCPDLLVRSDRINDIFEGNYLSREELNIGSPLLDQPFHYVVVDIKHSTLYLTSNGINIRNCNSIPAYKGQILMYTLALSNIQGYKPNYGFVLGKMSTFTSNKITSNNYDFMKKLGVIDYCNFDKSYFKKTLDAMNWIRKMRRNGKNWKLLPQPSIQELYPNMKNEKDGKWRKIKNELNQEINDITSVWMCGVTKRKIAHCKNILSWKNERCTSRSLEFKPGKISKTVDAILSINKQNTDLIRINTLLEKDDWRYFGDDVMEFYLDYETINSNMGQCSLNNNNVSYNHNQIIFMIGVGWEKNNKWNYKNFIINRNTKNSELNMITSFWDCINNLLHENNKSYAKFIHWTHAEPVSYKKLLKRHNNTDIPNKDFYDLYKLFTSNNIVVKGALNYSLKSIAKAMFKNEQIKTSWNENNPCGNGLNAMLYAYKLYKHHDTVSGDEPIMKDIINYNMIDCKVLWEITRYLRNNF